MLLDRTSGGSVRTALHDEPKDLQTDRMTEGAELLGMAIEDRGHAILLTNWNKVASDFFETVGRRCQGRAHNRRDGPRARLGSWNEPVLEGIERHVEELATLTMPAMRCGRYKAYGNTLV